MGRGQPGSHMIQTGVQRGQAGSPTWYEMKKAVPSTRPSRRPILQSCGGLRFPDGDLALPCCPWLCDPHALCQAEGS